MSNTSEQLDLGQLPIQPTVYDAHQARLDQLRNSQIGANDAEAYVAIRLMQESRNLVRADALVTSLYSPDIQQQFGVTALAKQLDRHIVSDEGNARIRRMLRASNFILEYGVEYDIGPDGTPSDASYSYNALSLDDVDDNAYQGSVTATPQKVIVSSVTRDPESIQDLIQRSSARAVLRPMS